MIGELTYKPELQQCGCDVGLGQRLGKVLEVIIDGVSGWLCLKENLQTGS